MRKISKLKGETLQPVESKITQRAETAATEKSVLAPKDSKNETREIRTIEKKIKRKERAPRSAMAKHLDRVLAVSVASLIILAVIYHFEQKNQILERAKGFIEAKIPFLLG